MGMTVDMAEGIGTLTLSHPPLNILTRQLLTELRHRLEELAASPDVRAVILQAEGKHFSAGADVGEHLPPEFEQMIPEFLDTIRALASFPLPVIAAVRGRCMGGGFEVVQAADIVIAGESALFGQPEILLGVCAPAACVLLPSRAGRGVAAEVLFTGDPLTAEQAAAAGIVRRIVPDPDVEEAARSLALRIARHSAVAIRATVRTLRAATGNDLVRAFDAAGEIYVNELMRSEDAEEGLRAFLEKRTPTWNHR